MRNTTFTHGDIVRFKDEDFDRCSYEVVGMWRDWVWARAVTGPDAVGSMPRTYMARFMEIDTRDPE